jgi:hypothetical protein
MLNKRGLGQRIKIIDEGEKFFLILKKSMKKIEKIYGISSRISKSSSLILSSLESFV